FGLALINQRLCGASFALSLLQQSLRLKDEATRSRLSEYLPEVRSRLLLLFSRQDAAVLATEEGKKNLIAEIKTTLSTPLVAGQPKQDVTDVLYTAFILR
ncbi:flagellar basal body-associated FliL family protein, partial [Escherichia coli]|uniref:flagellar basal body-associated FliL family protein n=1 Tax=Escherichia coli TaxID=562 RepID=UPI002263E520